MQRGSKGFEGILEVIVFTVMSKAKHTGSVSGMTTGSGEDGGKVEN